MTTESAPRLKITYATLRADNETLHAAYEAGLEKARARLGAYHRNLIDGHVRDGDGTFELRSPIDREILVGTFAKGTRKDARDAIAAARAAQPGWAATPWQERLTILRRAAELISERQMEYGGLMAIEVGKNRIEALGEVEESADLIRYYAKTWEDNGAYDHPMDNLGDAAVHTRSILRPHGVFAVISPFNFPMALSAGPTSAAMLAGNTVVFKPASAGAMSGVALSEAYRDAGIPDGVFNLVMGPGDTVGAELRENPGIDGIVFTGSYEVGMDLFKSFSSRYPRPCIVEMGGKNPAIVARSADLEEAAEGIMRSRLRLRRPEVLGQQPRLRRAARPRRAGAPAGREDRGDHHRRPAQARELAGPDHRPEGGRPAPAGRQGGPPRRPGLHRRRAPQPRWPGARLLRRADGRRRPARQPSPLPRRALRALHRGRAGRLARRGHRPRQRVRSTA